MGVASKNDHNSNLQIVMTSSLGGCKDTSMTTSTSGSVYHLTLSNASNHDALNVNVNMSHSI